MQVDFLWRTLTSYRDTFWKGSSTGLPGLPHQFIAMESKCSNDFKLLGIPRLSLQCWTMFCTFFDPEECDLRTTRPELQYNKWWRFFYNISYFFLTDLFHRFGSAGTRLVSRAARAGRLSEAVLGWWEGGPWTSAGGKVHLLCII